MPQKILCYLYCFLMLTRVCAQEKWASPEHEQLFEQARSNMAVGNYGTAINTYNQLIKIAPHNTTVQMRLADAYLKNGDAANAIKALSSINPTDVSSAELYYCIYSDALVALQNHAKAIKLLEKALKKYAHCGTLYHRLGDIYAEENKKRKALEVWILGIQKASSYAPNYKLAAVAELQSGNVLQGLLLGEVYLNIDTVFSQHNELKSLLFKGYKDLLMNTKYAPGHSQTPNLHSAIEKMYSDLSVVVADGITTTNLTMLHTRFVMDWFTLYHMKYPFSLFSYYDKMIREGYFDIYHEWLFGQVENPNEFNTWNTFHEGDMNRFINWKKHNKYAISHNDIQLVFYR